MSAHLGRCLVTGGNGYLGRALATELTRRGVDVVRLDTRPAGNPGPGTFVQADITDRAAVMHATRGIDTVFHAASVIDLATSGTRAQRTRSYQVNVRGTRNVIDACRVHEIRRLVYTSSSTVVFDGHSHAEVTEDMPYPTRDLSLYLTTKGLAERAVLGANEPGLATCAIRPGGIYGPGEQHHLPRLAREVAHGRFVVLFGRGRAFSEWSFIDNAVHGHLLAAEHLTGDGAARGEAFFINDGRSADTAEFFRPFIEGLGLTFPRHRLPATPVIGAMRMWEWMHRHSLAPAPFTTPFELRQLVVAHPCSVDKARRLLDYTPVVSPDEAVARTLPYFAEVMRDAAAAAGGRRLLPARDTTGRAQTGVSRLPADRTRPVAGRA